MCPDRLGGRTATSGPSKHEGVGSPEAEKCPTLGPATLPGGVEEDRPVEGLDYVVDGRVGPLAD